MKKSKLCFFLLSDEENIQEDDAEQEAAEVDVVVNIKSLVKPDFFDDFKCIFILKRELILER